MDISCSFEFKGFPEFPDFASEPQIKDTTKVTQTMATRDARTSTKLKKKLFLQELKKRLGVIQPAADAVGISRQQVLVWRHKDPEFAKAFEEISEVALDFAESKLFKLIDGMDTTATIFYLKTKGKKRGYVEKQEIDANIEGSMSFEAFLMESSMSGTDAGQKPGNCGISEDNG